MTIRDIAIRVWGTWLEQPEDPRNEWTTHVVTSRFEKYHDVAIGDVDDDVRVEGVRVADIDGDGQTEILAETNIYRRPVDRTDHWNREPLDAGWDDNRVAIADLDGDLEIVVSEGDSPT